MTDEATELPDDEPTSLLDIAVRRVRRDPSTPYLLTIDGVTGALTTHTYGQVLARATVLAEALAQAGVARGDRVGCYLSNAPSWVVASLAVWMNGAAVAAAGTLMPGPEAAALFALADARTVVAAADAPDLPGDHAVVLVDQGGALLGASHPEHDLALEHEHEHELAATSAAAVALPGADDLAVAIFTSGTTGRPKGVTHTHGDIVASARRVAAGYARSSAFRPDAAPAHLAPGVIFNPFGHMAGYSRLAFRMWIGRPTVVVPRFTVAAAKAVLTQFEMDTLQLTPTMIHMLADTDEDLDLAGVKYVTSGTAPLSVATRERFEARFGVPVMQAYGMSEVGAVAQERYDDVVAGRRGPGSVGRIAAGVEVRIRRLDDDRPEGEGEILVRTDEATKELIGGAPIPVDDEGWFATGDVGRLDDGILSITGRVQEKIIVGGFNVYPAEVEEAARQSPHVLDAVVVGLPDDRLGECPVAGIVWADEPEDEALLAALRDRLAHYKVPRHLFPLPAVPLTARDKVDREQVIRIARREVSWPASR